MRYLQTVQDREKHKYIFIEGNTAKRIENNEFAEGNKISEQIMDHLFGIHKSEYTNLPPVGIAMKGFDLGTIQFALHYMFESKLSLNNFIFNCYKTIKLNGHLIGTCYDGEIVFDKLKDIDVNGTIDLHMDGSKIWHIKKKYSDGNDFKSQSNPCGYKIGIFQDSINTENDEYLVHFPYFENLMKSYGFKMVKLESFEKYYKRDKKYKLSKEEKEISFINNAFTFQKVNEIDPYLVYKLNITDKTETKKELFMTSKPKKLKSTIVLTKS